MSFLRRKLAFAAWFVALIAVSFVAQANLDGAAANNVNGLVPEVPRSDTPRILDGRVRALEPVGSWVVAGGTFTEVSPSAGQTAISQPHLMAFDLVSGEMNMAFRPVLDGDVLVVEPGDTPGTVYIGGRFTMVNGLPYKGIAKLDLATGQVIPEFKANSSKLVSEIHLADGQLYVGGDFLKIRGKSRSRLAALDPVTGAVDPDFIMPLGDPPAWPRSPLVREIHKLDGDRLLVVHRATTVGGLERWGTAILDVSNAVPTVTDWQTNFWNPRAKVPIFGADVSPDGSYFVVTTACADYPPQCDTASAFPTTGGADVQPLWVTRLHDSTYAVAIDDNAVYVGGHFCQVESSTAPDPWGGDDLRDYSCYSSRRNLPNAAMLFDDEIEIRRQVAALSPTTGKALAGWNPESNARNGVHVLTLFDRPGSSGMLVGHDGTHVGGRRVDRVAVLDFNRNRDLDNLAPFGAPSASSATPAYPPQRAIDGTRSGNYAIGFGMQTNSEVNPWFALDLGFVAPIKTVKLFDRSDCCAQLLENVSVFISDVPFPSTDPAVLAASPDVTQFSLGAGPLSRVTKVPIARSGRYVRVQMVGTGVLQLAEVEVIRDRPADIIAPTSTMTTPAPGAAVQGPTVIFSGVATDDVKVKKVALSVQNRTTKQFLRRDGSWGGYQQLAVGLNKARSTSWSASASLAPGSYRVVFKAIDTSGNKQTATAQNISVG